MSPTIQDLAVELGVHKATVSRALSGRPGVSPAVRRRILDTAGHRGFFPHGPARTLATAKTETIALVFCDETSEFLTNPFYSRMLAGIATETTAHGYSLAFCSFSLSVPGIRSPLPKILRERRADGFLFAGDQEDSLIKAAHNLGYPVVLADHQLGRGKFDTVVINNVAGGRRAVEHLIGLGHRQIGFVGGSLRSPSFAERLEGYQEALAARGLPSRPGWIQLGESLGGFENMLKLLDLPKPPTAVFGCNDVNAVRAIRAIERRGLRVPEDVSVIGFDDSSRASESWPLVTTLRVDAAGMGRAAVRRLIERIEKRAGAPARTVFEAELVVRQSTAPCAIAATPESSAKTKDGRPGMADLRAVGQAFLPDRTWFSPEVRADPLRSQNTLE